MMVMEADMVGKNNAHGFSFPIAFSIFLKFVFT